MNGIDDLRSTLGVRADDVVDHDLGGRASAVHQRVGVVRRRRRAGTAGLAAVAAVAVVGGLVLVDGDRPDAAPQPGQRVFDQAVPRTMESLGYSYTLDQVTEGVGRRVEIDLEPAAGDRLVTWTTQGDDQRVRLSGYGTDVSYDSADFDDWVVVDAEAKTTIEALARDGGIAVAVYAIDPDVRPAGVTQAGATFRQTVGDLELVGSAVGEPGRSQVDLPTVPDEPGYTYFAFCANGDDNAGLEVVFGDETGGLVRSRACEGVVPLDVATGVSGQQAPQNAGDRVTVRATDEDDQPLDDPDLVLGIGVYRTVAQPDPSGLSSITEAYGHLWRLVTVEEAPPGEPRWSTRAPEGAGPWLASVQTTFTGRGAAGAVDPTVTITTGRATPIQFTGLGDAFVDAIIDADGPIGYRMAKGQDGPDDAVVGFYERVD